MRTKKHPLLAVAAAVGLMLHGAIFRHMQRTGLVLTLDAADGPAILKAIDAVEARLKAASEKAEGELATLGKVSTDTKNALDKLGLDQRELADRLTKMEQKGVTLNTDKPDTSWGAQFVKAASYEHFRSGSAQKMSVEVKNTILGSDTVVAPDRKPGIVAGAFRRLTLEDVLNSAPTDSNAVEYTRENVFTNAAAETAEGAAKPESALTFTLVNQPVATVAHWIKISRQLAMDAPALAAYINNRMRYGVNVRVENQLISGTGVAPNIAGLMMTGNFTPHGYTSAALGAVNQKLKLVRKVIADLQNTDWPADLIIMNPLDFSDIELLTDTTNQYLVGDPQEATTPRLWGLPVVLSPAMPVDSFLVMSRMAATVYNREGVRVDMSESDADNFTKNLITIRAERRVMLAVEVPAAIRGGDITPA